MNELRPYVFLQRLCVKYPVVAYMYSNYFCNSSIEILAIFTIEKKCYDTDLSLFLSVYLPVRAILPGKYLENWKYFINFLLYGNFILNMKFSTRRI